MPKTAVGLFENPALIEDIVGEIESLGFPRNEVRTMEEPEEFEISGVMSFPRLDFEVELKHELARIGATEAEEQVYIEGLRRGGALVLATAPDGDDKVAAAADIMNRRGAVEIEKIAGPEPHLPGVARGSSMARIHDHPVLAGRVHQPGGGAAFFIW
jgi:hypothetical protein